MIFHATSLERQIGLIIAIWYENVTLRLVWGTFADLTAASHELREAWLASILAEEEAIDLAARAKEIANAIELEGRARPRFDPDAPTVPRRGDRGGEG